MPINQICAICDNTNETERLCASCKADPVNSGWRDQPEEEISIGDISDIVRIEEMQADPSCHKTRAGRSESNLERMIADTMKYSFVTEIIYTHYPSGKVLERARRDRKVTINETARICGCTRQSVSTALKKAS